MSKPPFRTASYVLMPARLHRASLLMAPESQSWRPDPALPLPDALPSPWDDDYRNVYRQDFQPVKFWRNADIIADYLMLQPTPKDREAALEILRRLVARFDDFVVSDGECDWLESRFDFEQPGVFVPAPWVSGITNAFAIFGCLRAMEALGEDAPFRNRIRRLARAYRTVHFGGAGGPRRWISHVTDKGHLWFEEYPMPGGRPTMVLNGHIFAVFALNEAHALWPDDGFDTLVQAGALSVAELFARFQQRGKPNLYWLHGPRKPDYLPIRTMRQQFQLFVLTGDSRFLANAMQTSVDISRAVDHDALRHAVDGGSYMLAKRLRFDARLLG